MRPCLARVAAALVALVVLAGGCHPRPPEQTKRPALETPRWSSRTGRSETSCQTYRYLHIPGPSPEAESIVLLHGGIFDQRIWLNFDRLATRFSVFALEWPDNSPFYTGHVEDYGDIVADFLGALSLERVYVAGVSMGAYAAVDFVSRKKQFQVPALFLFSAVMYGVTEEEVSERTDLAEMALSFAPDRLRRIIEWRVGRVDFDRAPGDIQQREIYYTRPYPYYYQVFSMALNQGAERQDTQAVRCPVLFLHGTDDETMPVDVARLGVAMFPDAEFRAFEGYKHSMVFSKGPELVPAMFGFLERKAEASDRKSR